MEGSSEKMSDLDSETRDLMDLPEFDSIGSWADEVDSDLDGSAGEAESESAEAIKFNPKYAFQAQKLKESFPASLSVEHHAKRGRHDQRPHGDSGSYDSASNYKRNSSFNSRPHDEESKYRNHNRRSGNSRDSFDRRPHSSDSRYKRGRATLSGRDRGGPSPLRSPNSTSACVNYGKRRHNRRQNHGESHRRSNFLDGIDEDYENMRKKHSTPSQTQTVLSEEDEEGTPILSKWQMKELKCARTRRRLCLPEDVPNQPNSEAEIEQLNENDEERLARREKDIIYGKSTGSYQKYIELVPCESRSEDCRVHPRTPLKTRKCSRRSWDAQIRIWKRRVHTWAAETVDFLTPRESKQPVNSGPRWADVVAGTSASNGDSGENVVEKATENVEPKDANPDVDDDDESFLDDFELDCVEITDQMNNSIKLDCDLDVENLPGDMKH